MEKNKKILNRVMLIMNYDSSKTLNENTTELGIVEQAGAVKDIEKVIVGLKGAERAALRDILFKDSKNIIRSDGSAFKSVTELESALKNGELAPSVLGRLRSQLLRNPNIGAELKAFLIQDLTKSPKFIEKYKNSSHDEVVAGLQKAKYTPEQAQEIATTFEKQRKGLPVEPIAPEAAVKPPEAVSNKTDIKTEFGQGNTFNGPVSINNNVTNQISIAGKDVENISKSEVGNIVSQAKEVPTEFIKDGAKVVVSTEKAAVNSTKETLMKTAGRVIKTFMISKAVLIGLGVAGGVGLLYLLLRKKHPDSDIVIVDENGNDINGGSQYTPVMDFPFPYMSENDRIRECQLCLGMELKYQTGKYGPVTQEALQNAGYDTSQGITEEMYKQILSNCKDGNTGIPTPPPVIAPPERVTPIDKVNTSRLSLSNVANSLNTDKLASSPNQSIVPIERRNELIDNIRRNKKYVGPSLNPEERTFVDDYMNKMGNGSPSKEKITYQNGTPIKQNIRYK